MGRVYVIGLVGGIGSGKSTVASMFARLGAEVFDADAVVHELLGAGAIRRKIARRFGDDVLTHAAAVDRKKLAEVAFTSKKGLRDLEKILHPPVIRRFRRRVAELRDERGKHIVVLDAPLLFEAGLHGLCDEVVFVQAPKAERLRRAKKTRGWGPKELEEREKHQENLLCKRRKADTIIRNHASRHETFSQVRRDWKRTVELLER